MKKCVVIGAGLGGLSSGLILARNGYDVTVLEQERQVGGCLQCFVRGGVKYETGMHFIGSADKGQVLYRFLRYLDIIDDIQLSRLDVNGYDVVSLLGQQFRFANGGEQFVETLAKDFPHERDNLRRYYQLVEQVAGSSSLHTLRLDESAGAPLNTQYQLLSINAVLDEIIGDEMLRNVLVGNLPLYAATYGKTPFSTHAFIADFYNQSAFRVVGGSDAIAHLLVKKIQEAGGKVLCARKATKIVCEDGVAVGVEAGGFFPADVVVAAIHPARVLELCDSPMLRPAFRRRIASLPQTIGGFSVYLKFKPDTVPYMNSNFYGYRQSTPWGCEDYNEETWPKGYLYMHFCNKEQQQYAANGILISYMHFKEVEKWMGTKVGHRGDDYERMKKHKAELLLDLVEKDFPGFRNSLQEYHTSTPLTYYDYTGTEQGGMYGIAKDISEGMATRVHHRTKIPNLLLTGQNVNSHGILGVLVGTMVTCAELLTTQRIFNDIIQANR